MAKKRKVAKAKEDTEVVVVGAVGEGGVHIGDEVHHEGAKVEMTLDQLQKHRDHGVPLHSQK